MMGDMWTGIMAVLGFIFVSIIVIACAVVTMLILYVLLYSILVGMKY